MKTVRSAVSVVTALAFTVQVGMAFATPPPDVQPIPYAPAQPIPLPSAASQTPPAAVPMQRGAAPPTYLPQPPPPGVTVILPQPGLMMAAAPVAFVHLEAESGVVLESALPRGRQWTTVCAAPCDVPLPLDRDYRVSGEGIRNSRVFRLEANPGQRVIISVSPTSKGAFAGGIALTSVGAGGIVVGLVMVLVGLVNNCVTSVTCEQNQSNAPLEEAGASVALIGLGAMVAGIVLFATNIHSRATPTLAELMPAPVARPETAWLKAPVWHDSPRESSIAPATVPYPVFSRSF
jgi:hypothetical protein